MARKKCRHLSTGKRGEVGNSNYRLIPKSFLFGLEVHCRLFKIFYFLLRGTSFRPILTWGTTQLWWGRGELRVALNGDQTAQKAGKWLTEIKYLLSWPPVIDNPCKNRSQLVYAICPSIIHWVRPSSQSEGMWLSVTKKTNSRKDFHHDGPHLTSEKPSAWNYSAWNSGTLSLTEISLDRALALPLLKWNKPISLTFSIIGLLGLFLN